MIKTLQIAPLFKQQQIYRYLLLIALGFLSLKGFSQQHANPDFNNTKIENGYFITTEDGLPTNKIRCIAETPDGFIWLGTGNGLCRYDGSQVKVFSYNPEDSTSIYDNRVSALATDSTHLWIGTHLGFSILDLKTEKFRNFQFDNFEVKETLNKKLSTRITSIDLARNGEVWMGTFTSGIFRYLPEQDSFICYHYPHELVSPSFPSPQTIDHVIAIQQDRFLDHIFWAGTTAGILQINSETNEMNWFLKPVEDEKDIIRQNSVRSFYQHLDSTLYYNTWFSKVIQFNPKTQQFSTISIENERSEEQLAADKLLSIPIAPIQAKNDTELWIESLLGLMTYHIPSKKWTRIQWNVIEKNKFFGVRFVDSQQRIWIHPNIGLCVFDPRQQQFIEYDYSHLNPKNIGFSYYFLEDSNGEDFAVLPRSADGIYSFKTRNREWKKFRIPQKYLDVNNRLVPLGYSKAPNGNWTIVTREGVYDYNLQAATFQPIPLPNQYKQHIFTDVTWDQDGNLWIGTLSSGLIRWDTKANSWKLYKEAFEPDQLTDALGRISYLFADSQGNIWVNRANGYSIFDVRSDTIYNFLDRQDHPVKVSTTRDFTEDHKGRVWLNSVNGTIAYGLSKAPEKGLQKKLDFMKSHQMDLISFMDMDDQHNLWLLSRNRVAKLNLDNMQVQFHSLRYGIEEEALYSFKVLKDQSILIGGENKIWIGNINDLQPNPEKPVPYLTDIQVLQAPYPVEVAPHLIKGLDLSYAENFFSFEFSSIGFTRGEENQFRYRLENFDEHWTPATNRRFANFTNVPPGEYTFQLQVANNEGIWNEATLELPVKIATPWWQQVWFWVLVALLSIGLIYLFYRWRIRSVRKEERLRMDYEKKLTNVEMAALRAQMNPHFIFNSLNSIEYYIISNEQERAVDYLNRFSRLVRLILQNSKSSLVPLKDDLEALRLYIEIENMRFDNLFDYDLKIAEGIDLENMEIPPLLLQPYVENAIWHGLMQKKSGRGKIDISIRKHAQSLICILEDNGIGRDAAKKLKSKSATKGKSYGMKITKDRLEAINLLGDGKASVQVFDLKDNFGTPKGTRIEVIIPISN